MYCVQLRSFRRSSGLHEILTANVVPVKKNIQYQASGITRRGGLSQCGLIRYTNSLGITSSVSYLRQIQLSTRYLSALMRNSCRTAAIPIKSC